MRSSRIAALAASGALAAVTVLGGAGIAQAQSADFLPLGSLGSSAAKEEAPDPSVSLTIEKADKAGTNGTIVADDFATGTNPANCKVTLAGAADVKALEDGDKDSLPSTGKYDATVAAFANGAANWTVTHTTALSEDARFGAVVNCDDELVAYAYEAKTISDYIGDFVSSIDFFGSLGGGNDKASTTAE